MYSLLRVNNEASKSFFTIEIVTLAGIKVSKVIKTPFSNDTENEGETEDEIS